MTSAERTASSDELAIFIDSEGNYRILVPHSWSEDPDRRMPEFAYLAVASVLRLSRADEVEFQKSMAAWAREDVKRSSQLLGGPPNKRPRYS